MKKYYKESIKTLVLYARDRLLKRPNLKFGLIATTPEKIEKDGDYMLGFVEKPILKEDGDYTDFLPIGEQQDIGSEKMHCVSESACNCIETRINYLIYLDLEKKITLDQLAVLHIFRSFGLTKFVDGRERCWLSTRYVAVGSGTNIRGNSQKAVADFIRHYGLVPKDDFPYVNDWNEYYYTGDTTINGNKLPKELIEKGKKFAEFIELNYEWIRPEDIDDAYPYGAIQPIGYAWGLTNPQGIYIRPTRPSNHAFLGHNKQADYQGVFDSYAPFNKKVALNFYIDWAMLLTLRIKQPVPAEEPSDNIITNLINMIKKKYIVLFHGAETDKSKNTGTYWYLKKLEDGVVYRQKIDSIGAIMMFIWVFVDMLLRAISNNNSGEVAAIKNTTWGEIGAYPETNKLFGSTKIDEEEII